VILGSIDRLLLVGLYRLAPGTLDALKIIRPATLLRWHRTGFRAYWRWKSRPRGGRPATPADIRRLIRGKATASAVAGLEDFPAQCRRHHIDRSVRRPDNLVSAVVRAADLAAWSS